ncbi:amino acid transporter [Plenodomus tracheiphilus IPT5]|uniref:Amino acid transporter n=1 Tax=Plenodomus tracheiphilus IPT5 TaxID=1408161 RepID=A0A6A7B2G5_9PLEO|nr:amino acid transporter [Plenodomus tracheiphilus IPT5]
MDGEVQKMDVTPSALENGSNYDEKTNVLSPDTGLPPSLPVSSLERYINLAAVLNFGIVILGSWESLSVTFQIALLNGGPASMFYGAFLAGLGACAIGFSLAELASIDPTVGAQYRWSANLAPAAPRFWGLLQGWITVAAWCFTCSGPPSILANIVTALAIFNNEDYVPQRWHTSLIMIAGMTIPFFFNLWFRKLVNYFETMGGILHVCLFIVFIVVFSVFGTRSDPEFVFQTLVWEESGWDNKGVSWGLGLLSMSFSVAGADSVLHMCDEVKKVRTRVPRSIILTSTVNSVMLIIFVTFLLFYMGPLDVILDKPLPILWVIYHMTGSAAAANTLTLTLVLFLIVALFNIFASVSRLVWVFALDNGLPFSKTFAYVHPKLKLPVNALLLVGTIVTLLSFIYIASATAFNALISLQAIGLHVSYFLPILFVLLRKLRGPPPPYGPFQMGVIGIPVNVFALIYLVFVVLWMPFPQVLPVTKDNMNYSGPIFGAVILGALSHWLVSARKTFKMPVIR